jgi:hypothetical protein
MIQHLIESGLVHEILKNQLLSLFEPNPVSLSAVNESEVERAIKAIDRACGKIGARFNEGSINRNSFLAACLDATCDEKIEHLIVGYGTKYRTTTKVSALHHMIGDKGSVSPTATMASEINRQITKVHKGEVLIFHNHPGWFLNIVLDNLPLASSQDRLVATNLKFNWFQLLKTYFGNGDVKLYVGENGFVKEFKLPPFDLLVDLYRRAAIPRAQFGAITA